MYRILYIPLDDRPCNYKYPRLLSELTENIELVVPPKEIMGQLKRPAELDKLWTWIFENVRSCQYGIISVDSLIYGNIVNSRLHNRTREECEYFLNNIKRIKEINLKIKLYANNLVARVANANNDSEDPSYWSQYGTKIWKYSYLIDKISRKHDTMQDNEELQQLINDIPKEYLGDFLQRRKIDRFVNLKVIELVKDNYIDQLVIPKDDNAEYGYASMEQDMLSKKIYEYNLMDSVMVYPGADEVGCILFTRIFCLINKYQPRVYTRYSSVLGPTIIPKYEDRPLHEGIKAQITSAGGILVDSGMESDLMLAINSPRTIMMEAFDQENSDVTYNSYGNMNEFIRFINYYMESYKKPCAIADVCFVNGADNEFMDYLNKAGIIEKISSFCGWNTAQNSVGLALSHGIIASYYNMFTNDTEKLIKSQVHVLRQLIEGWLFEANVLREYMKKAEEYSNINPYMVGMNKKIVIESINKELKQIIDKKISGKFLKSNITFENLTLPWDRVFDIDFDVCLEKK